MCKSEIFAKILQVVAQETEVSAEQILSSKKDEETVDARYLLVHFLSRQGFSQSSIAKFICKNIRTVNNIITGFSGRQRNRKMFGINLENIRNTLGNNSFYA